MATITYATVAQLQEFRKYKIKFATQFGADKATVQRCVDELIIISLANANTLNAAIVVAYITANPSCSLQDIFTLLNPQTELEKETIIDGILHQIPMMIGTNNVLYTVNLRS